MSPRPSYPDQATLPRHHCGASAPQASFTPALLAKAFRGEL